MRKLASSLYIPAERLSVGRVLSGEFNKESRTAEMLVGGRARGGKQRRATIASVLGIEAGEKKGAGQVHSDAAHCHTAPGQSQLDCLRN